MSPRTTESFLGQISAASRDLIKRNATAFAKYHPVSSPPEFPTPACIFPQPQPLRLDLDLGLDHITAEKISSAYIRAAIQLKAEYEQQFGRVWRGCVQFSSPQSPDASRLQSSLCSAFISDYTARLKVWIQQVKTYGARFLHARQQSGTATVSKPRRSFSQHAISILERFFEVNAFPSRLEKHDLATQANMKYTQVHIWFQNRRRRSRKEGKELKKGDPASVLPSELETSVVKVLSLTESNEENANTIPTDVLNAEAPHHAFPCTYPPVCSYDPFPTEDSARRFTTPWMRKPSSIPPNRSPDVDIAQVTSLFSRMTLYDDGIRVSYPTSQYRLSDVLGFTIVTPHAPHPALILTASSSLHSKGAARPLSVRVGGACASSLQVADIQAKSPMSRRKVAPLPKRMPTSASVAHRAYRGVPLDVSDGSTYPSSSILKLSSATSTILPNQTSTNHLDPRVTRESSKPAAAQHTLIEREVVALPKRALARPVLPYNLPPSSPRVISTSSRMLSTSSSTSSGSSPPSGLDTPLSTPPLLPITLPFLKASVSCSLGPASSFNSLFNGPSMDGVSLSKCLQLQLEPTMQITAYASS